MSHCFCSCVAQVGTPVASAPALSSAEWAAALPMDAVLLRVAAVVGPWLLRLHLPSLWLAAQAVCTKMGLAIPWLATLLL